MTLMLALAASTVAATGSAHARTPCVSIEGAERLWVPAYRWVIVGEMHGTAETPASFADLVCAAATAGRRVTVALEWSRDDQPVLDAYLVSDGGVQARAALLALPIWHDAFQDGRSSLAFMALLERLRVLHREGLVTRVVAVDVSAASHDQIPRDTAIANAWRAIALPPDGIVLALVGNVHAMRLPFARGDRTIQPAASLLPRERTVTLDTTGRGGTMWACMADGCGVQQLGGVPDRIAPAVEMTRDPENPWDGTFWLGRGTTASPPADPALRQGKAESLKVEG